jgi:hypothetical protein
MKITSLLRGFFFHGRVDIFLLVMQKLLGIQFVCLRGGRFGCQKSRGVESGNPTYGLYANWLTLFGHYGYLFTC